MKVDKTEEYDLDDLDDEDQLDYIKAELTEYAVRVVVAVLLAAVGLWYGATTTPHPGYTTAAGYPVPPLSTGDIVFRTVLFLGGAAIVAYLAYTRHRRITAAVRTIQEGEDARVVERGREDGETDHLKQRKLEEQVDYLREELREKQEALQKLPVAILHEVETAKRDDGDESTKSIEEDLMADVEPEPEKADGNGVEFDGLIPNELVDELEDGFDKLSDDDCDEQGDER